MIRIIVLSLFILPLLGGCAAGSKTSAPNATERKLNAEEQRKFDEMFFEGIKYKSQEKYDKALTQFLGCLRMDGRNDAVMYEIAQMYFIMGDLKQAEFFATGATQINKENKWYYLLLVYIYDKTQNYQAQKGVYERLLVLDSNNPDLYFDLAFCQIQLNDYSGALKTYNKLEKMVGVSEEISIQKKLLYIRMGDVDKAAKEIQNLIAAFPDEVRYYIYLAELYEINGYDKNAEEVYAQILAMNSNSAEVHMAMGDYYTRKKDFSTALGEYALGFADSDIHIDRKIQVLLEYYNITQRDKTLLPKVLELCEITCLAHAEDPKSWAVMGDFYARESEKVKAREMYKKSIATGGNKLMIWNQVLFLNMELKDYEQLVRDSKEALDIFPNEPFMYLMNGFGHYELKQYQQAIDIMVEGSAYVIDNKPLKAQFFSTIGECYYRIGDHTNSDKYFDKCLVEDPNNILVLNNYAYYLSLRNEKLEQAAEMSEKSNRLDPNNGTYQDTYAWVLFKQGKYEEALIWIEKAISNGAGGSAVVVEHYGDILYQLGRKEDAHVQWKKAKELGEGSDKLNEKVLYGKLVE